MKTKLNLIGLISLTFSISALASPALESPEKVAQGLKFIETEFGQTYWATEAEINALADKAHAEGKCGGYMDLTDYDYSNVTPELNLALMDRDPVNETTVRRLMEEVSAENLYKIVEKLSSFPTRHPNTQSAVDAINWLKQAYTTVARRRNDTEVELFQHSRFKMPSLIARIKGSGPLANEVVVIGGHIDSINQMGANAAAPGADDDASGSATVLETFRVLAQSGYKPNRTIEFMAYAGEEMGLLGSQDIAAKYKEQNKKVIAVLQFDMTFYPGSGKTIGMISDSVNPDLTKFVTKLIDEYVKIPWVYTKCGYPCSDHASWTRNGYASAFPFESKFNDLNHNIHSTKDTLQNGLDAEFGLYFAKLAVAFVTELGTEKQSQFFRPRIPVRR